MMEKGQFPNLLNTKENLVANFSVFDLSAIGLFLIISSFLKIDPIAIIITVILFIKILLIIREKIPQGFLKGLDKRRTLNWAYVREKFKNEE